MVENVNLYLQTMNMVDYFSCLYKRLFFHSDEFCVISNVICLSAFELKSSISCI